jgi:ATPase subunit of ABC transporter with duplicated ATPase domains
LIRQVHWENFATVSYYDGRKTSKSVFVRFNFGGDEQNKKVSMLSGGERNRAPCHDFAKEEGNVLFWMSLQMIWISTHFVP